MRWILLLCLTAVVLFAEGTKPKPSAAEYDVHAQAGSVDIGAEYMVHSFSAGQQMFLANDYLVVEVAVYPLTKDDPVTVDLSHFKLRLNNKTVIQPDQPAQAAASLTRTPWYSYAKRGAATMAGAGGPIGQHPSDPSAQDPGSGVPREKVRADEILINTALPQGVQKGRAAGFIYFPYRGKTSSIKSLELEFEGATLKLK